MTGFIEIRKAFPSILLILVFAVQFSAQKAVVPSTTLPEVIKVDEVTIKPILQPDGRPLLINFWATWCVPCVEEFPLLVKLHEEYKGRIDIITVSLDDLAEIKRDVPNFLKEQNATMPAYLLHTPDENSVIGSIAKSWSGGLPFTILLSPEGETLYTRQGIIKIENLKPAMESSLKIKACDPSGGEECPFSGEQ